MTIQASLFESRASTRRDVVTAGKLPPGLTIVPDFVSLAEEKFLLDCIDDSNASPWLEDLKRRVKHLGFRYDYKARALTSNDRIGDLPQWATELGDRLVENEYFKSAPDQVIINEYFPGQGIASHVDRDTCFGPTVASISLGSDIVMDFRADADEDAGHVLLPARSAVILSADARYHWKHGIASRKVDTIDRETYKRSRRVSLTFRTVLLY